ncbi:hypothetical protein HOP50_01g03680 [Chloropicon primus]|uniref:RING-CH-type domain-containing protein n=1 Tax=Chloropicon primus TaxID=1764295 RepID=A0A5B8MCK1_9CHLO|nr:hypothetical protein A3770_01p03790 [Chloropicon primus]UPQ97077.1 hypothetical protein HOP50_01g03680 [Chloropicon primus]|eukprot:QDZ17861.1 hypothetical protein A3770_01p03790 [Chloropicon primus]
MEGKVEEAKGSGKRVCRFCLGTSVPQVVEDGLASCSCRSPDWTLMDSAWTRAMDVARRKLRPSRRKRAAVDRESKSVFISPCACKGTNEHVHEKCLLYWCAVSQKSEVCPICLEKYVLPRHFHDNGVVVPNGVHLLKLYFSSCFLLGGLRGVQTTASSALQVAASPLCLFPGLPLQAVIQVLEVKPQAAQTLALACVSRKLLPAYTRLALQASGFVLLKGWIMGGCMGSLLGGKCILKLSAQFLKKAFRLGGNTAVTASA